MDVVFLEDLEADQSHLHAVVDLRELDFGWLSVLRQQVLLEHLSALFFGQGHGGVLLELANQIAEVVERILHVLRATDAHFVSFFLLVVHAFFPVWIWLGWGLARGVVGSEHAKGYGINRHEPASRFVLLHRGLPTPSVRIGRVRSGMHSNLTLDRTDDSVHVLTVDHEGSPLGEIALNFFQQSRLDFWWLALNTLQHIFVPRLRKIAAVTLHHRRRVNDRVLNLVRVGDVLETLRPE